MAKHEEYRGRWVRLKYGLKTKGGTEFKKGSVCKVRAVERGKLFLEMKNPDPENIFGPRHLQIRAVEVWDVELLADRRPRCPDKSCSHLVEVHWADQGCKECEPCMWWPGKESAEKLKQDLAVQSSSKNPTVAEDDDVDDD